MGERTHARVRVNITIVMFCMLGAKTSVCSRASSALISRSKNKARGSARHDGKSATRDESPDRLLLPCWLQRAGTRWTTAR